MAAYVSDYIEDVRFNTEAEQKKFDELLNSKEYYLEVAKENLKGYTSRNIYTSGDFESGKLKIGLSSSLSFYMCNMLSHGLEEAHFNKLRECEFIAEDDDVPVIEYVENMIKEWETEIDDLAKKALKDIKFEFDF